MADYHFHVSRIKRSAGQSVVAAAAYRAGERLTDDYYGTIHNYSKKPVITSGILLPSHAPLRFSSRETLWNEVERVEKHPSAQLAYNFNFSLQNEFSQEENIELAVRFLQEQFVARGMICDYAIHNSHGDDEVPNPHVHVLCPIRPLTENGQWGNKRKREYALDDNGERIRDEQGEYVFRSVYLTDWDEPDTLEQWRQAWADLCNQKFEEKGLPCRIDNRSFARQGIDQVPTIHEGPAVREMEKRGICTNKGDFNRWVKRTRRRIRKLFDMLAVLADWIQEMRQTPNAPEEPTLVELIREYYQLRKLGAYSKKAYNNNSKEHTKVLEHLVSHKITTLEALAAYTDELRGQTQTYKERTNARAARRTELKNNISLAQLYIQYEPFHRKLNTIKFKKSREKYQQEHSQQLDTFQMAKRKLKAHLTPAGELPLTDWEAELAQLETEIASDPGRAKYQEIKGELDMLYTIKRCASEALKTRALSPEQQLQQKIDALNRRKEPPR